MISDFADELMEFRTRAVHNPHAWGIAAWCDPHGGPLVVRDPHPMDTSYAAGLLSLIECRTMIAHIRYATVEPRDSVVNAHLFVARIGGRDWVFAHNGYLSRIKAALSFKEAYVPHGTTDSEAFFAVLVERLSHGGSRAAIVAEVTKQFAGAGKLNFLLSDGNEYYFFSNHDGLRYKTVENMVVVATVPIGNRKGWVACTPGTLYVTVNGGIVSEVIVETGATYKPKRQTIIKSVSNQEWDDPEEFIEKCQQRPSKAKRPATDPVSTAPAPTTTQTVTPSYRPSTPDSLLHESMANSHATSTLPNEMPPAPSGKRSGKRYSGASGITPVGLRELPATGKGRAWSWEEIEATRAAMKG
jgi:predicted glutamine amidotransferase